MFIPKSLRDAFKLSFDGDAWGTVQDWRFSIAEFLYHITGCVPDEWQFNHGPFARNMCEEFGDTCQTILSLWDEASNRFNPDRERWDWRALVHMGNVLNRYADILKAQGRDY